MSPFQFSIVIIDKKTIKGNVAIIAFLNANDKKVGEQQWGFRASLDKHKCCRPKGTEQ